MLRLSSLTIIGSRRMLVHKSSSTRSCNINFRSCAWSKSTKLRRNSSSLVRNKTVILSRNLCWCTIKGVIHTRIVGLLSIRPSTISSPASTPVPIFFSQIIESWLLRSRFHLHQVRRRYIICDMRLSVALSSRSIPTVV